MPSCGYEPDYRALEAERKHWRAHYIAKGVMAGTHKLDELVRRRMKR